jgi:hypothetical protein
LRDYNSILDNEWPFEQNTIIEIKFTGDEWLSRFAGLSSHGELDRPVYSSETRYWDFFAKTLEQLVFCLDVRLELTTPFFDHKYINNIDIFETSNDVFAREFNRVFTSSENDRIPEELIPLIEFMNDGGKPKTRGTISTNNFIRSINHIGGLTVFSNEVGNPYGARFVTGVHQATPTTVSRQTFARSASADSFKSWAHSQLNKLDGVDLNDFQIGAALISIYEITGNLGSKYFLSDMNESVVYFEKMELTLNDKIFILCFRHPLLNKIQITHYQDVLVFTPREYRVKSLEFKYVLELHSGIDSNYGLIELYGEDLTSRRSTAIGQLFTEIQRRGFQPTRSALTKQTIGTYAGPDGGHPDFFSNKIKNGMPIEALGIVVTVG